MSTALDFQKNENVDRHDNGTLSGEGPEGAKDEGCLSGGSGKHDASGHLLGKPWKEGESPGEPA